MPGSNVRKGTGENLIAYDMDSGLNIDDFL